MDNAMNETERPLILVAEDDDSNFKLIKAIAGKKCNLMWARTGKEILDLYKQHRGEARLILMDIKMPNIDGLDATRAIREMDKDIPVIAVSAYAYENEKEEAMESGCNEFLTKPIDYDILKKTLNKYFK